MPKTISVKATSVAAVLKVRLIQWLGAAKVFLPFPVVAPGTFRSGLSDTFRLRLPSHTLTISRAASAKAVRTMSFFIGSQCFCKNMVAAIFSFRTILARERAMMGRVLTIASGRPNMQSSVFLRNAANCDDLASEAQGPRRATLERLARGWRAVAETQDWLDGRMPPLGIWQLRNEPEQDVPAETPLNDPRQQTDWPNSKQTDEPWKGNPEKEQFDPQRPDIDLEKWQETNTH
jgi:hypothetical protein